MEISAIKQLADQIRGEDKANMVCPKCGEADPENISIYTTDIDIGRWWFSHYDRNSNVAVYQYGKSVYTESSEYTDNATCWTCNHEWDISTGTHNYDLE